MKTQGLANISGLPEDIKNKIIKKYGSLENYYFEIYFLEHTKYNLFIQNKFENQATINEITSKLYDLEDELEDWGVEDGSSILIPISDDHGDIIVKNRIDELNKYLAQFGKDFKTMRAWLNDNMKS